MINRKQIRDSYEINKGKENGRGKKENKDCKEEIDSGIIMYSAGIEKNDWMDGWVG